MHHPGTVHNTHHSRLAGQMISSLARNWTIRNGRALLIKPAYARRFWVAERLRYTQNHRVFHGLCRCFRDEMTSPSLQNPPRRLRPDRFRENRTSIPANARQRALYENLMVLYVVARSRWRVAFKIWMYNVFGLILWVNCGWDITFQAPDPNTQFTSDVW